MADKEKIKQARTAVDKYRADHAQLYSGGWYKGISDKHTPLLRELLEELRKRGFNSLDEFFTASRELQDGWE